MNPRQRKFAQRYAATQNVYRSALEAGYTENYAKIRAHKVLMNNPDVVAEVKRIRERLNQTADKTATDVVNEFSKIAFTDRVDFLKPDPLREGEFMYKSPDELTPNQRHIVEKTLMHNIEIVIIENKKPVSIFRQEYSYILSDKAKALEQMGRHFGIFDDKLRLGVSQVNPFTNASPKQLAKLKKAYINTMNDPKLIEGEFMEVKPNGG